MIVDILVHCPEVVCLLVEAGPVLEVISFDLFFHIKRCLDRCCVSRDLEWAENAIAHAPEVLRVALTKID